MKYKLDKENSSIQWRGYDEKTSNRGTLQFKKGEIEVKDGTIIRGRIIMDMNTMETTELNLDEKKRKQLTRHLKSPEFFAVDQYDEMEFDIRKTDLTGGKGKVAGHLKVKGCAYGLTVSVDEIYLRGNQLKADGKFNIEDINLDLHKYLGEDYDDKTPGIEVNYHIESLLVKESNKQFA